MLIGPNGSRSFSIPLKKGKHNAMPIRDVKICYDEEWSSHLLKLCQSNYKKSPYYDYIIDKLSSILQQQQSFLFDLNMDLLEWIVSFLQIDADIQLTVEYKKTQDDAIKDLRQHYKPGKIQDTAIKPYPQVFLDKHGFLPHMSILDMLFCCGKESVNYL